MKRLLLVGAGHAHLHVLTTLAGRRPHDIEVVLVAPYTRQLYSGMLPGWIAGHYPIAACAVPLLPLIDAAGVRFVQDALAGVDAERNGIRCAATDPLEFDILSLDTGAATSDSGFAACRRRLPLRPFEDFIPAWEFFCRQLAGQDDVRVAVVGGGAGGIELALNINYRLRRIAGMRSVRIVLIAGSGLLPGHGAAAVALAGKVLREAGVDVEFGRATGSAEGVCLNNAGTIRADAVLLATGVTPPAWLAASGLALREGFVAVDAGQRSLSHPRIFAAGDIATRADAPHAKSGVYAVRAGPVLSQNLLRAVHGAPLLSYRPQTRSLYLLATGPKRAIASWGSFAAEGAWLWRWKDWIDRRFLERHRGKERGRT